MQNVKEISNDVVNVLKDKIQVIKTDESSIYLVGPIRLPVNLNGNTVIFQWYSWLNSNEYTEDIGQIINNLSSSNLAEYQQSSVLVYGDFKETEESLIRMHSICHTGDIFGSKRCDCGFQLKQSMQMIVDNGAGALFYLANHEGRGIGLFSKAMAYILQENGSDTVDANEKLGFVDDSRNYGDAIEVLKVLRTKPVTLITNNPKSKSIKGRRFICSGTYTIMGDVSEFNENYLHTKINRSGHMEEEGTFQND